MINTETRESVCWWRWGKDMTPRSPGVAHYIDDADGSKTLCGKRVPTDANVEAGDYTSGMCKRCRQIDSNRPL